MMKQNDPISKELEKNFRIPQRLEPENVEKMLADDQRRGIRVRTRILSTAAAVAVAAGALTYAGMNGAFGKNEGGRLKADSPSSSSAADDSNESSNNENNGTNTNKPAKNIEGLKTVSYSELGELIAKNPANSAYLYVDEAPKAEDAEQTIDNTGKKGGGKGGGEHSETYEQVAGVTESDIVKTDGENIFYTTNGQLFAFKAKSGILSKVEIDFTSLINDGFEFSTVEDMYLVDDKLTVVIDGENRYYWSKGVENSTRIEDELPTISVITFDVSDINNIREVSRNTQQGYYIDSRMIGTDVYISTYDALSDYYDIAYNADGTEYKFDENSIDFVPSYTVNGDKYYVPAEDIIITDNSNDCSGYTVVSVFNTEDGQRKSGKAKLGGYASLYMTTDQLYLFSSVYDPVMYDHESWMSSAKTQIVSFDITGGAMTTTGNAVIKGYIGDRFWLGNCGDTFCAAAHFYDRSGDETNYLYTFDKNLNSLGVSKNFGDGEQIKSVTYRDNIAYIVTFVQTDPLFAIDVSDPTAPTIVSELKMPGFSTHLREFSEGRMIGFGQTADEENGAATGLKLSMYDTADPNNVKELDSEEISVEGNKTWFDNGEISYYENYYSTAVYDEKALLINANKNIIAFPYTHMKSYYNSESDENTDNYDTGVKFYSYSDETGFVPLGSYDQSVTSYNYTYCDYSEFIRIIYIDDVLYLFSNNSIVSVSMKDYSTISEFSLAEYIETPTWYWYDPETDVIID